MEVDSAGVADPCRGDRTRRRPAGSAAAWLPRQWPAVGSPDGGFGRSWLPSHSPRPRGYGRSDKPVDVDSYSLLFLAADATAMLDALDVSRAHIVGHDWGAALAWVVASLAPDRVDHLAVLSVGNPLAFAAAGLEQREKSWYMLLFQFEGIAEQWLTADDWANFRAWGRHPDADAVIEDLQADGSLTPGLNWYRANVHPRSSSSRPSSCRRYRRPPSGYGARATWPSPSSR